VVGVLEVSKLLTAQQEFTHDLALLILEAEALGFSPKMGEVLRPAELQAVYVAAGKSWTKNSRHLLGLAVDLLLFRGSKYLTDEAEYRELGEWWENLRPGLNKWGVGTALPRKDSNHFERKAP
jgi:hypothetical protein